MLLLQPGTEGQRRRCKSSPDWMRELGQSVPFLIGPIITGNKLQGDNSIVLRR